MRQNTKLLLIIAFTVLIGVFLTINILINNFEKEAVVAPVSVPVVGEKLKKLVPVKEQKAGQIQDKQEEAPEEEPPLSNNQPLAS